MSFIKIQKIDPTTISFPEYGSVYLGQDNFGLWEMDDTHWWYIQSGIILNSSSSGTSGVNGTSGPSGKDGTFLGSSGTSGKSGISGTVGTSGSSGNSSAGTSGVNGTSGSAGTSGFGTSGSSGVKGSSGISGSSGSSGFDGSNGTSGSSGISGIDGGYGGATRKWVLNLSNSIPLTGNTFISANVNQLSSLNYIRIHRIDGDGDLMEGWLSTWNIGLFKIEDRINLSIVGIYIIHSGSTISKIGNFFEISNVSIVSGYGNIIDGNEYLISFVQYGIGGSGVGSGSSGTSGSSGITLNQGQGISIIGSNISTNIDNNSIKFSGDTMYIDSSEFWSPPPLSTISSGDVGSMSYDDTNYLYVCVNANYWLRFSGQTF
jgi:hypothetical protein